MKKNPFLLVLFALLFFNGCRSETNDTADSQQVAPPALNNVVVTPSNGATGLYWIPSNTATSYNVYWSLASGVSKTSGTKISNINTPYKHQSLANGTTYYYVVTAVNSSGESPISSEASATPSGQIASKIYSTVSNGNIVTVSDTLDGSHITNITVGTAPKGIAIDVVKSRAYVANNGMYSNGNTVSVIDTQSNTVVDTITVGSRPTGVAVDSENERVYVTNQLDGTISVINSATNTVIATITGLDGPWGIAINPVTAKAYVADWYNGHVTVIDTNTNTITASILTGSTPQMLDVNPVTNRIYVVNSGDLSVSVIDGETDALITTLTGTLDTGLADHGVKVNLETNLIYVTNDLSNTISVIDGSNNTVISTIDVINHIRGIDIDKLSHRLYFSSRLWGTSAIDLSSNTVIPLLISAAGDEIAIMP